MGQQFDDSSHSTSAIEPSGRTRFRWQRKLAASLALTVAMASTALLVNVGQLEHATDAAVLEALRFGPGLTT